MTHIRKHHKVVDQINSPLGSFPQATSARVLFGETNVASVQGNSDGQVNSPKVVSAASFDCGKCGKHFATQTEVDKHMEEENDDEELLNAVKEAEEGKYSLINKNTVYQDYYSQRCITILQSTLC